MAFLSELDVINDQLATLGESPLNAITDDHPMVASGKRLLKVASWREQAKGWWFNKELLTLAPEAATGFIFTPEDAISVDPVRTTDNFIQRGRRLYNALTASYVFPITPVPVKLIRNIPFADLPASAASYIGLHAVLAFQRSYDADSAKTRDIKEDVSRALLDLNAEHIRNMNVNLLNRPSTLSRAHSLGGMYPGTTLRS